MTAKRTGGSSKATAAGLRQRAEAKAKATQPPGPDSADTLSPAAARQALHDLHVHQIELELQNEELRRAQAELEAAKARYFDLYDLAPAGYLVLTEKGLILEANLSAAKLLGVERKQLARKPLTCFIVPEDQDTYYRHRQQLSEAGTPQTCELRLLRADSAPFWARLEGSAAQDAAGASVCSVVVSDITESKRAQEELQRNESRLRSLVSVLQHPADDSKTFLDYALEQAIRLTGSKIGYIYHYHEDRQEFVLNTWSKDVMPQCSVADPQTCYALGKTGIWGEAVRQRRAIIVNDFQAAHPLKRGYPQGHVELLKFMTVPIFKGMNIVGVVGLGNKESNYSEIDILQASLLLQAVLKVTERMHAEAALRDSVARLNHAEEIAHLGSWELDLLSNRLSWSDEIYRIFGLQPQEFGATYEAFLAAVHPEDRAAVDAAYSDSRRDNQDHYEIEHRIVRKHTGEIRHVQERCRHVRDASGAIVRSIGMVHDITERKQLEAAQAFLLQCGYPGSGHEFFPALAQYLAQTLGVDFVCIDRLLGDGLTAQTVAMWSDGKFLDNVEYALKDTPCGDVVGKTICCFPRDVCKLFPRDAVLQELRSESYIGTTLWSYDGKPIGLIALIGRKPLVNPRLAESMLKLVAVRASGELERQQAEAALAHSARLNELLLNGMQLPAMLVGRNQTVLAANRIARQAGAAEGEPCWQSFGRCAHIPPADREYCEQHGTAPPDGTQCTFCQLSRMLDASEPARTEVEAFGNWWEIWWVPIDRESYLHYAIDITERKRTEDALRLAQAELEAKVKERTQELQANNRLLQMEIEERRRIETDLAQSELKFRTIADFTSDWEYWQAPEGTLLYCSPSCERITGHAAAEFMSDPGLLERVIHLDDLAAYLQHHRGRPHAKAQHEVEFRVLLPDGAVRWCGHVCQPVFDTNGTYLGRRASNRDITERKELDRREQLHLEQMLQSEKLASLGTLVAGVAHEINNPNMFITLNTPVLRDLWDEATTALDACMAQNEELRVGHVPLTEARQMAEQAFANIMKGSERIKNIVTELKEYAREAPPELDQQVDVNRMIRAAVTLSWNKIKGATDFFAADYAEGLPPVRGNSQRLEQVMINLFLNACDAIPDKGKAIHVRTRHDTLAKAVIVRVVDQGSGMTPDVLARIKDPFFTTKRDSGGTGLGVSISAKIIDEHGGRMVYESKPGQGTTVTLTLPAAEGMRDES
ncbi:MAG: hypothetical protein A3K19_25030 [Lentisphaerae bacterium RIFOXYB12_FULL_65_16]|nr:MAG: hypothetical protein A3K18_26570 [Lentisphaerae bacterium RIFOXYA12_64_32]OGV91010.1 MAG: hypothetical protein A3K19_25030 [Lentisphaerae bacterium RIFOXYB12_FULL_65_16]